MIGTMNMPKRKTPELSKTAQFKRFRETVKKLSVDETGKDLESTFSALSVAKNKKKSPRKVSN